MSKIVDGIKYSDDMKTIEGVESEDITSAVIAEGVTEIGKYAFEECSSLTSIEFTGTKAEWAKIKKGLSWNDEVPAKSVKCADGEAEL